MSKNWRDHLPVHPAADLFPLMSESELRELADDIKKHGQILKSQVVLWKDDRQVTYLLDGRNRLDAAELVFGENVVGKDGIPNVPWRYWEGDPYDLVLSFNIHRRHLTEGQRRDLIAAVIKAKPEESDRAIAKKVGRDHKTVAKVRKKMESTGEVSPVEKRVGADGKRRKSPAKKVETDQERRAREEVVALANKACDADPEFAQWLWGGPTAEQRATGSAEISVDDRRAYYTATENPTTVDGEILPPEPKDGNPIWNAWCKAKPKHRREFVTLGWDDIEQERKRAVKHREGQS